jgi:hypothetical protein
VATLVQSTPVASGFFSDAVAAFPSAVTAGNTIIVLGGYEDGTITSSLSTNRSDSFTYNSLIAGASTGTFVARATAVGGTTTITMTGMVRQRFIAMEWADLSFDTGAGVGTATGTGTVTATTPNSSTAANSVSFSVIAFRAGGAQTQGIATGFTLAGSDTSGGVPFVGGYRAETVAGAKAVTWTDPGIFPDERSAIILVFTDTAGGGSPPVLTSPTGAKTTGATGDTSATGTVSTDKSGGTLYRVTTTNAAETGTTVKTGASQSVTVTGVQNITATGLTPGTAYRHHYLHRDGSGNDSTVSSSAQFTTDALFAITTQPTDQTGAVGETDTYTSAATGVGLTYQWFRQDPTP